VSHQVVYTQIKNQPDTIVIGGGVVGLSIAYGLARAGERVRVLDEGDDAFRASRGNFGLVWVQGKGANKPGYAVWSLGASKLWPAFADDLGRRTGNDLQLAQDGGLMLALDETELAERSRLLAGIAGDLAARGIAYPYEILGANALRERCPHVGPDVVGASFSPMDGHVSPLMLLKSLTAGLLALGGELRTGQPVEHITYDGGEFRIAARGEIHGAGKIVLAAGLGNAALAPMVGMRAPVRPLRGQVLISERVEPFLDLPTGSVRQTGDGGVQIGESAEEVGFDKATTTSQLSRIAGRALRMFPLLGGVNIVRTWGALRVMTPDGLPIYQASSACPGAFLVTCHSGITLAAQHAGPIADWIRGAPEPLLLADFKAERFHV
jgi:glycine/D-amino acid oxidase-like deaminating enzyme